MLGIWGGNPRTMKMGNETQKLGTPKRALSCQFCDYGKREIM